MKQYSTIIININSRSECILASISTQLAVTRPAGHIVILKYRTEITTQPGRIGVQQGHFVASVSIEDIQSSSELSLAVSKTLKSR